MILYLCAFFSYLFCLSNGFYILPDPDTERDLRAVYAAIDRLEKEPLHEAESDLNRAQRWLFLRHWVLETIDTERPGVPKRMDPVLMKEALTNAVELNSPLTNDAKKGEGEVTLAFKSLEKWAMGDASKDNGVDGVENSATGDSPKQKATKDGSTNESRVADQTAVVASRKAVRDYLRSQLARYTHDESQIPLSQGLKIVCIWYCELEYWTAKLIEAFPPPPSAGDQIVGEDHRGKEKEGAPKDEEDYAAMAIMFPDLVPSLQQRLAEKLLPSSGSSAKEQQKDADYHEHPPPSSSKNNEDEKMLIKAYKEAAEMVETLGILKYKIEKKELFDKPMVVGKI